MWSRKKKLTALEIEDTGKKYKLGELESVCRRDDQIMDLRRVIALRDIPRHGVTAGDIGGYIESEFNLAQAGDSWIGGGACVSGNVKVKDNALITDLAILECRKNPEGTYSWVGGAAVIKDSATVSGDNYAIAGNAVISDFALLNNTKILGSPTIKDHASLLSCTVNGSPNVAGQARLFSTLISDDVSITDQAYLMDSSISGKSSASGSCKIEKSKIRDNTHVSGSVRIKEGSICEGENYLSGDLVIPPNHYVINKTIVGEAKSFFGVLPKGEVTESVKDGEPVLDSSFNVIESSSDSAGFKKILDSIEAEYKSYSTDIVKLIKYPLMADPSVPETQEFIFLLRKAKRLLGSKDEAEKQEVAEKLERAYMVAEANALKVSSSLYSENDRKKTEDAKVFINKACDELSTVAEKKIGFRSTMKALEGVIALPEDAVTAFREKIGLLEIEA